MYVKKYSIYLMPFVNRFEFKLYLTIIKNKYMVLIVNKNDYNCIVFTN